MCIFATAFATCAHSLMDRIKDSGSFGWGSIPHERTNETRRKIPNFIGALPEGNA